MSQLVAQAEIRNALLAGLPPDAYRAVQPALRRTEMVKGAALFRAGEAVDLVCFPEGGVVSIDDRLRDGTPVGLGIVGAEGMAGWPVLIGDALAPHDAVVAIAGATALDIKAERLLAACAAAPALHDALLRFVARFMRQMGRTIASNLTDSVERRLARWLLMNHDRIAGDEIQLTHSQLGVMLGVRRASVTGALHLIEESGAIRATRGCILVRDRAKLRALAGQCYEPAEVGPAGEEERRLGGLNAQ